MLIDIFKQVCVRPWSRNVPLTVPTQTADLSAAASSSCPTLSPHWAGVDCYPEKGHRGSGRAHIQRCDGQEGAWKLFVQTQMFISTICLHHLFFFFFFFLRWNADKWSGVMDHRRAAGLVASSLQVTPLYVQCVYLPSIYNNVAYDCLCVGMSQRCDRGCPGLDSITSDWWRLVRSSRVRLCHGSSGCSRSGRNATNMDSLISLI